MTKLVANGISQCDYIKTRLHKNARYGGNILKATTGFEFRTVLISMKKIRLGGELLPRKSPVPHIVICLILLVVPRCEGESETVCEFQDANLLFPNTPASSASDTTAKTWNKEKGIRVASWMASTNFVPIPSYENRLMEIGENSIKIRNVTRSDNGTYTLVLISKSAHNPIEFPLHLEVLVSPTNQCVPNITRKGDSLRAELPPDECGIPMLTVKWKSDMQKLAIDNISVLNFESGVVPGMYTACAIGRSSERCFKGNVHELCSNYTVSALQPQNKSRPVSVWGMLATIFFIVIGVAIGLVYLERGVLKRKLCPSTAANNTEYNPDEEIALMEVRTSAKETEITCADPSLKGEEKTPTIGVQDIKRHLIKQYKTVKAIALSPCYEENLVDVLEVYCDLDIIGVGVEDVEGPENVSQTVASYKEILCGDDKDTDTADNVRPIPAVILGECGSGKSTWCKNLVHQWCQFHDNNETTLNVNDSSISAIVKFDILMYIPLKKKLEDLSFTEYLRNELFPTHTGYFEYTMNYILEHRKSVLILIDGLDEVSWSLGPILNLLKEKEVFQCSIIFTSRLSGLECLQEKVGRAIRIFQIQGMSIDRSREYASKVLEIVGTRRAEKLNVDHFWKFAKYTQVLSMCHIPLLCLSLIFIWIENKAISADPTDVLLMIVEYYLRRAMTREWYKANISTFLEQQHFDISIYISKTKHKQYLRDRGYLLKVISGVAEKLWDLQMQVGTNKKNVKKVTDTKDNGNDVEFCLQTGILMKTFRDKLDKTKTQITFSHTLLLDFFVALSIAMGKQESFRRCITTTKAVVKNSYMIQMLCQVAPNIGQEIITDISQIFDKDNEKDTNENTKISYGRLICNIQSKASKRLGVAPVNWLQALMYTDELSNAKLSLLTEGLKFTKHLTHFVLRLLENTNELVLRLPILPKLQDLQVDIENCTLLLHEEDDWKKGNFSELGNIVINSVNIDVKSSGSIMEALSSCRVLRTLELCPKDDSDAQILAPASKKTFYGWECLAKNIKDMRKLGTVRLHNLHIGEHLPTLLDSLRKCPTLETLELINLKEMNTGEEKNINTSDRGLPECKHNTAQQLDDSNIFKIFKKKAPKRLLLVKNTMSEKSWSALSKNLGRLSPNILHVEQVHQSGLVLNQLLQGIGKCKDLNILSICCIRAGNDPMVFSSLRSLNNLQELTLCKITMPDQSWEDLFETISGFTKLEKMSLAYLEIKSCFIDVQKLSKLKRLEMREIHLEEALWIKLGDNVILLPRLEKLELVSCKMSKTGYFNFSYKMKHYSFHILMPKAPNVENNEMFSVDMVVTPKEGDKSKDVKTTLALAKISSN